MEPTFFPTPVDLRHWFEQNHDVAKELLVGFYKKDTGKPSITWPEAVDEALCFGWIDGVRKGIDDVSYMIRFTPRKPNSIWSAKNIASVERLSQLSLMQPAGLEAFQRRKAEKSAIYSFERKEEAELSETELQQFQANENAWGFFQSQAPSYRRAAFHWIVSAKRPETRSSRLTTLINDSAQGWTVRPLTPPHKLKERDYSQGTT